jgi:D-methionine transport system permease protein
LIVNLISYSAMAGLVGGGGLGQLAIQYGYQRFLPEVMGATCLLLIALVQGVQWIGNVFVHHLTLKRGVQFHDS